MTRKIEMVGRKIGKLTVIKEVEKRHKNDRPRYLCRCECGKEIIRSGMTLRKTDIRDCGCARRKEMSKPKINMLGKKYNRLTVVELVGKGNHNQYLYRCVCDCGNEIVSDGYSIRHSNVKSCGCLYKERLIENKLNGLIGKKFGKLTVLERVENNKNGGTRYRCICDCGNEKIVNGSSLSKSLVRSCGCLHKDQLIERNTTHNGSKDRLYGIWSSMKRRCYYKRDKSYKNYGARGITVCEEWMNYSNFEKFMMENGYDPKAPRGKCTIDRIDVNGNYCPENCRIITIQEQMYNKRNSHLVTYKGETKSLAEWSKQYGVEQNRLHRRLVELKWDVERALTTPVRKAKQYELNGESHSLKEWSKILGVPWSSLRSGLNYYGRTLEDYCN